MLYSAKTQDLLGALYSRSSREYEYLARLQCSKSFGLVPPLTGPCPFVVLHGATRHGITGHLLP